VAKFLGFGSNEFSFDLRFVLREGPRGHRSVSKTVSHRDRDGARLDIPPRNDDSWKLLQANGSPIDSYTIRALQKGSTRQRLGPVCRRGIIGRNDNVTGASGVPRRCWSVGPSRGYHKKMMGCSAIEPMARLLLGEVSTVFQGLHVAEISNFLFGDQRAVRFVLIELEDRNPVYSKDFRNI
jgi:hypothetical protein